MKWKKERPRKKNTTAIALVGKPNVGKSSLVNALLGNPRLLVSPQPGTTVDSTDTPFKFQNKEYVLIDTAGLRRRGKVGKGIEKYSVLRSLAAISRADVVCLVLDWEDGLANQDLHVSEYILEAGAGLIIVINKYDLMNSPETQKREFLARMQYRMNYMPWAPVIFTSAKTRKNIFRILESSSHIAQERRKKIPDKEFEFFLKAAVLGHPPLRSGHTLKITGGRQESVSPPAFAIYTNNPDLIHFSYRRFIENEIRRKFGFFGTSIRLYFKKNY